MQRPIVDNFVGAVCIEPQELIYLIGHISLLIFLDSKTKSCLKHFSQIVVKLLCSFEMLRFTMLEILPLPPFTMLLQFIIAFKSVLQSKISNKICDFDSAGNRDKLSARHCFFGNLLSPIGLSMHY
jgi:hypothetical protein